MPTPHLLRSGVILSCLIFLFSCGDGGGNGGSTNDEPATGAPTAYDISLRVDGSTPYVSAQLEGSDPDGDTLSWNLDSERSGPGYDLAFVDAETGEIYITLADESVSSISLQYRVTDGQFYSDPAFLTLQIDSLEPGATGLGEVSTEDYNNVDLGYFDGDLFGSDRESNVLPERIDLSGNFPTPGDQGRQGSCVGWAIGYALKSYQEKMEEGWDLASSSTVFSPAWIYNQINGGRDSGSSPLNALQLIVDDGAATLASMPYNQRDYTTQPSSEAIAEAAHYKADSFVRVSSITQIKNALASKTPVTIGIYTDSSFHRLSGSNSVYNGFNGELADEHGRHMVTITGYDNNRFGGAFKVINSWGTDWGDNGFFWLPYDQVSKVVLMAYALIDKANEGGSPVVPDPPDDNSLPNLIIKSWKASYNQTAGGAGELQWRVNNSGNSVAKAGADVNLMLSRDREIDSSDIYVVYEEIPFDLEPGRSAFRDEDNTLKFTFPETLRAGDYYMAVWVDDLNQVEESNERDNLSWGSNSVSIAQLELPDLEVQRWWASWYPSSGDGSLEYEVKNIGTAQVPSTTWRINLVLSRTESVTQSVAYRLFTENGSFALDPDRKVYRNEDNQAKFNLYRTTTGGTVQPGEYYMSLWVDDLNIVRESDEDNNYSVDNSGATVGSPTATRSVEQASDAIQHRFNGNSLPNQTQLVSRVIISRDAQGRQQAEFLPLDKKPEESAPRYNKTQQSADVSIYPVANAIAMPAAENNTERMK